MKHRIVLLGIFYGFFLLSPLAAQAAEAEEIFAALSESFELKYPVSYYELWNEGESRTQSERAYRLLEDYVRPKGAHCRFAKLSRILSFKWARTYINNKIMLNLLESQDCSVFSLIKAIRNHIYVYQSPEKKGSLFRRLQFIYVQLLADHPLDPLINTNELWELAQFFLPHIKDEFTRTKLGQLRGKFNSSKSVFISHFMIDNFEDNDSFSAFIQIVPVSVSRFHFRDDDCSICFEPLFPDQGAKDLRKLDCQHYFHSGCINEWEHKNGGGVMGKLKGNYAVCPICKVKF
jgi:hypothetical protein